MLKSFINTSIVLLSFVLILDVFMFLYWFISNQYPIGDFYIGTITAHILKLII